MLIANRATRCALLLVLFAAHAALGAGIPKHLSHQGVLTDTSGVAVPDGLYTLDFDIYDAASNGNHLFGQQLQVDVVGGVYNVLLSDNPTSPGTLEQAFQNPTTYLQITITDAPTGSGITPGQLLAPRQKLASVPYAFVAQNAEPPSLVLVDQHQANDDPEVVLALPPEFDRFEIDLIDVFPVSTSPVEFWLQVSSDGGVTWDTGSSDYGWILLLNWEAGVTHAQNTNDSKILLHYPDNDNRLVNQPGKSYNNRILVQNPGGGNGYFALSALASYFRNVGFPNHTRITGIRKSVARIDAIRFRTGSGNILGGKFKAYGLR